MTMLKRVAWVLSGLGAIFGILTGVDQLADGIIRQWLGKQGVSIGPAIVYFFLIPVSIQLLIETVIMLNKWIRKSIKSALFKKRIRQINKLTITTDALFAGIHQSRKRGLLTIDDELKLTHLVRELTQEDLLLLEFFDSPADWLEHHDIKLEKNTSGELLKILETAIPLMKGKKNKLIASLKKLTVLDLLNLDAENFDSIFLSGNSLPALTTSNGHKISHIIKTIKK